MTGQDAQTAEVTIGDTIISVSVVADWLTIDPDIHSRVRAFVLDLRAMAADNREPRIPVSGNRTSPERPFPETSAPPATAPVPPRTAYLTCKHCGRTFDRVQGKAIHEKYCAPGSAPPKRQGFPCSVCGELFTDGRKRVAHQRDCATARAKQGAVDRLILEREQQMAAAPTPPPASLSIVDRLEGDDAPSLECRHCAKTFRTVDGRLRHERGCEGTLDTATNGARRIPTCGDCGCTFVSTGGLVQHQQKNCAGPKPTSVDKKTAVLRCDDCRAEFELGAGGVQKLIVHALLQHKREIHHDERQPKAAAS